MRLRTSPFTPTTPTNDWAEFAADGGVPFLLLVFIPFAAASRRQSDIPGVLG